MPPQEASSKLGYPNVVYNFRSPEENARIMVRLGQDCFLKNSFNQSFPNFPTM